MWVLDAWVPTKLRSVRAEMQERANEGEFEGVWMAHETDVPLRDAFPNGWGDVEGDALD